MQDIKAINIQSFRQRLKSYKKRPGSLIMLILVLLSAIITAGIILFIVGFVLIKGIPNLKLSMFEWNYNTGNLSMLPAIINTATVTAVTLLMSAPIGVFSAIYLLEYAKRGSRLVKLVRMTTETLSGIPSIVYGLFGYLMFTIACGFSFSLLGGALTLAIMTLPMIMRTTEEALRSVPDSFREGSFGLGAGRLRTVFKIVLPSAAPGILAGIILAIGRIVGETAAIILPAGTAAQVPSSLMGSGRTLAVHVYALLNEGLYTDAAYATAVVLLAVTIGINLLSSLIAKKLSSR